MPHLIVLFSAALVILAIFLILIKKTKLVENPENRQLARFLPVFILLTYSYNLCLHYSNFSLYLKVSALEPVRHLPYLGIRLQAPIENGHYQISGKVDSLSKHALEFKDEFSSGISSLDKKGVSSTFGEGSCVSIEIMGKKIVSVAWLENFEKNLSFISAHEEMHVVQMLAIKEAFQALTKRFDGQGYEVDFSKFNEEQQAHLAAILLMLEKGKSEREISEQCSLAEQGLETWEQLQKSKKINFSENGKNG